MNDSNDLSTTEIWSIEARAFPIPYTPFTHNFWALTAPNNCIAAQLHGLAVDPATGKTQAIGNSRHLLQVIHRADIVWSLQPGQPAVVAVSGPEPMIRRRWQAAVDAIPAINALQIAYPDWWQHFYKVNSNSVFTTLGLIMGLASPQTLLASWAPGIARVISAEIVKRYAYTGDTVC